MASVRSRLTVGYSAAVIGVLAVYTGAIVAQQRLAAMRSVGDDIRSTARLASAIIERQSFRGIAVDTVAVQASPFTPAVTSLLEQLPGFVIIGDSSQVFFWSAAVRQMQAQAENPALIPDVRGLWRQDLDRLTGIAYSSTTGATERRVTLNFDDVLLTAQVFDSPLGGGVRRIVVGESLRRMSESTMGILGVALTLAPLAVGLAVAVGWGLAGRVLAPVNQMVNDVEAITDGRSLHRRVVLESDARDELGRLAQTVNDMIARLENSFGSLRRFTADASHELRTPLAVIRADVERAMTTSDDAHERAVALEEALQQVSRMTGLVESLLTLARADEGRFDLITEPVPLEPVIREVAETGAMLGEERRIAVTTPLVEPVTVPGDAERLRQLLLNLVTNAVKYTGDGGRVEVTLERRHGEAIVTVKDNGMGIAAADLPFIFDRFWRVDRARSRSEGSGVGLGLAICQWIAQAHRGRIDVSSRLGRGTTFTVVLPSDEHLTSA
ncbi:MAG: HAMP domain-containing protein [Gemmatimonadetes bacterium]|nr:HAMP domain-containing protein [Gemmatimonadota bacterium]